MSIDPELRALHSELADWAEKQQPVVREAAQDVIRTLWVVTNNPPRQQDRDELARYTKILADAVATRTTA